jgi:hypothetical protein
MNVFMILQVYEVGFHINFGEPSFVREKYV